MSKRAERVGLSSYLLTVLAVMVGVPGMASLQNERAEAVGKLVGQSWTRAQIDWTCAWLFGGFVLWLVTAVTWRTWRHNRTEMGRGRYLVFLAFLINALAMAYWTVAGIEEAIGRGLFPFLQALANKT